jgi:hypothetical protein
MPKKFQRVEWWLGSVTWLVAAQARKARSLGNDYFYAMWQLYATNLRLSSEKNIL